MSSIQKPTKELVNEYLKNWKEESTQKHYVAQEKSLKKLFLETYKKNEDLDDILIKVSSLNDFYSTYIRSTYDVARHIQTLNIDKRLEVGDATLVEDIAKVKIKDREFNFLSFASKYCSLHNPNLYPIYDSMVVKALKKFRNEDKFSKFKVKDLRNYIIFKEVIIAFINFYNLNEFNFREIDLYLWQVGKNK